MLKPLAISPTQPPSLFLSSSTSSSVGSLTTTQLPVATTRGRRKGYARRGCIVRCDLQAKEAQQVVEQAMMREMSGPTSVKAVVSVKVTVGGAFAHLGITRGLDDIGDLLGKSLLLELVSSELDPSKLFKDG